jgi:hypothetical protein
MNKLLCELKNLGDFIPEIESFEDQAWIYFEDSRYESSSNQSDGLRFQVLVKSVLVLVQVIYDITSFNWS